VALSLTLSQSRLFPPSFRKIIVFLTSSRSPPLSRPPPPYFQERPSAIFFFHRLTDTRRGLRPLIPEVSAHQYKISPFCPSVGKRRPSPFSPFSFPRVGCSVLSFLSNSGSFCTRRILFSWPRKMVDHLPYAFPLPDRPFSSSPSRNCLVPRRTLWVTAPFFFISPYIGPSNTTYFRSGYPFPLFVAMGLRFPLKPGSPSPQAASRSPAPFCFSHTIPNCVLTATHPASPPGGDHLPCQPIGNSESQRPFSDIGQSFLTVNYRVTFRQPISSYILSVFRGQSRPSFLAGWPQPNYSPSLDRRLFHSIGSYFSRKVLLPAKSPLLLMVAFSPPESAGIH